MDDIDSFFNFSKEFKRVPISGGYVNGRVLPSTDDKQTVKREVQGTEYVKEYQEAEAEQLQKRFKNFDTKTTIVKNEASSALNELEDHDFDDKAIARNAMHNFTETDPVFEKYSFNYNAPNLPIVASRSEILSAIQNNPVIVLQGSTGCGKSTQVPQFILDDAYKRKEHCNIIVTQPRRIAARSIASRVCTERKWELGSLVGFQVGLNVVSSEDTRLLFCTTGILLEKLIRTKSMANYTHIILDEVHEREQDMDFLFIVVRRLLATNSPNCKVILMSATIEAPKFAQYFLIPKKEAGGQPRPAPIIQVDTQRPFKVGEFYLCQLTRLRIDVEVRLDEPGIDEAMYLVARKLVLVTNRIDNQDQYGLPEEKRQRPAILIFLPGILEIETMFKLLEENAASDKYLLVPLHSSITFAEQQNVFRPTPLGYRKIVLCTNIAESSITIPDVKYVFDFCLTKCLVTDTSTNVSSLQLCWASRDNCTQRSGRAGRVMDGRVYRLVPRTFYDHLMEQSAKPEIQRCPLDRVVLKTKILDMGPPESILALAMDTPNLSDINNTILMLKEMGALLKTTGGVFTEHDGDLSFVGRVMAALPVDVRVSRLIIFGYCFSVLEECIIIGAGLNVKSIFNNPFSKALQAYSKKMRWSDGSGSDLFAILKAYRCWQAQHAQHNFNDANTERLWANRYFLQVKSLDEMNKLVAELKGRLDYLGIRESTGVHRVQWSPAEKSIILKCVISGAFYPNYFSRVGHGESFDRESFKTLCGRDPNTTVFFGNFNHKYVGQLYVQAIKEQFREIVSSKKNVHVSFDSNTEKIFVSFRSNSEREVDEYMEAVPGMVATEVYKAVKMRRCNQGRFKLDVMNPKAALEMAEQCGLGFVDCGVLVPKMKLMKNLEMIALPRTATKEVYGRVTHVENPSRFFVRSCEEDSLMRTIFDELNTVHSELLPFESFDELKPGLIVAARYNSEFHRAKVISLMRTDNSMLCRVRMIDYGMFAEVKFTDLRQLSGLAGQYADIPPRVFECRLAEIQPSSMTSEKSVWTADAIITFGQMVDGLAEDVCVQVYSVVKRVANVVLLAAGQNVNEFLVSEGHAQVCDENYMSKQDHDRRLRRQTMAFDLQTNQLDDAYLQELGVIGSDDEENEAPLIQPTKVQCHTTINLSGPFSPLESNIFSMCGSSMNQGVTIEPHSVNSVLLEDRSQDLKNSFVVAASVTRSTGGNQLTARETTLMPNIPGFGALMAMIFCPYMEFQQDRPRSRYTSILCGLGYNEQAKRPIFEEHDIRFELDVEISTDDLQWINQIRFAMDAMLYTKAGEERPNILEAKTHDYTQKIKTRIIQLLERDRRRVAAHAYRRHNWGYSDNDDIIKIKEVYDDRAIFPFHSALRMSSDTSPERVQQLEMWFLNCKQLRQMSQIDVNMVRETQCKLCQMTLSSAPEIKMHLFSRLHLDREKNIGYLDE